MITRKLYVQLKEVNVIHLKQPFHDAQTIPSTMSKGKGNHRERMDRVEKVMAPLK